MKLAERELLTFSLGVFLLKEELRYSYVYTRLVGGGEKYLAFNQMAHGGCEFFL